MRDGLVILIMMAGLDLVRDRCHLSDDWDSDILMFMRVGCLVALCRFGLCKPRPLKREEDTQLEVETLDRYVPQIEV